MTQLAFKSGYSIGLEHHCSAPSAAMFVYANSTRGTMNIIELPTAGVDVVVLKNCYRFQIFRNLDTLQS